MVKRLSLINGIPRMTDIEIYDDFIDIVSSGASGENQINLADAETGDSITLPNKGTYEENNLEVWLNGDLLDEITDYNFVTPDPATWQVGSNTDGEVTTTTKYTKIALTFDTIVGDRIRFRVDRS